jgi:hypothetical protein
VIVPVLLEAVHIKPAGLALTLTVYAAPEAKPLLNANVVEAAATVKDSGPSLKVSPAGRPPVRGLRTFSWMIPLTVYRVGGGPLLSS